MMRIRVECYAGYRGEETPRRFWLGAKKIEVQDVLDRWMAPDHRYFKVLGHDKAVYILRHDAISWDWDLTFYQQAGTPNDPAAS
jgi:hypothetical protein